MGGGKESLGNRSGHTGSQIILMGMLYQGLGGKSDNTHKIFSLRTGSWLRATNILGSSFSHIHFRKNQSSSSQIDR